jgi:hypothetical protein
VLRRTGVEARVELALTVVLDRQRRLELLLAQLDIELEGKVVVEAVLGLDLVGVVRLEGERDGSIGRGGQGPAVDASEPVGASLQPDRSDKRVSVRSGGEWRERREELRARGWATNEIGVIGMDIGRKDGEGDGDAT